MRVFNANLEKLRSLLLKAIELDPDQALLRLRERDARTRG